MTVHTLTKPELQAGAQMWGFSSTSECVFSQFVPDWGEKTKTRTEISLFLIQYFIRYKASLNLNVWMNVLTHFEHIFGGNFRYTDNMPAIQTGSRSIPLQFLDELDNRCVKFKSSFARSADEKSICNVSDKSNIFISWKYHFEEL